ncbi:MAG: hydrogenase [Polyangiaceae bacterium]|nr:hydrogenase [Polyangiaceae bacterium]
MSEPFVSANGEAFDWSAVPQLPFERFADGLLGALGAGQRAAAFFGVATGAGTELVAVLASERDGLLRWSRTLVAGSSFPALTPHAPELHLFEREIAEQHGLRPEGHPWSKPVRFVATTQRHRSPAEPASRPAPPEVGVTDFFRVEGHEVHEVAVGPVHAGVIEPGHFRFQCHGEEVLHLEISLGYQHRGVERALAAGPDKRGPHYAETLAGDTTVGHATAYCQVLEALGGVRVPARAQALRGVALELERIANHVGDLGALAGDVAYLPTASFCGRLRGEFLNLTAELCGSRFGRGLVRPGGVRFDVPAPLGRSVLSRLDTALGEVNDAVGLLMDAPSVQARFEETGRVSAATASSIGLVGPAARASGLPRDARHDFPHGVYRFHQLPVTVWHTGDVFARAHVRRKEVERSGTFVRRQLEGLPGGALESAPAAPRPGQACAVLVEGWRGELCHVALTDLRGRFSTYKVVDPSFHNWLGLALALRGQPISDFPLCNKSFNLSYCGFDL